MMYNLKKGEKAEKYNTLPNLADEVIQVLRIWSAKDNDFVKLVVFDKNSELPGIIMYRYIYLDPTIFSNEKIEIIECIQNAVYLQKYISYPKYLDTIKQIVPFFLDS